MVRRPVGINTHLAWSETRGTHDRMKQWWQTSAASSPVPFQQLDIVHTSVKIHRSKRAAGSNLHSAPSSASRSCFANAANVSRSSRLLFSNATTVSYSLLLELAIRARPEVDPPAVEGRESEPDGTRSIWSRVRINKRKQHRRALISIPTPKDRCSNNLVRQIFLFRRRCHTLNSSPESCRWISTEGGRRVLDSISREWRSIHPLYAKHCSMSRLGMYLRTPAAYIHAYVNIVLSLHFRISRTCSLCIRALPWRTLSS